MTTMLHWGDRKTRKPHVCWGCGHKYPAGSKMTHASYVDGEIFSCYWCETCREWMDRNSKFDDEYGFSDLRYADDWKDIHREINATPYIGELCEKVDCKNKEEI